MLYGLQNQKRSSGQCSKTLTGLPTCRAGTERFEQTLESRRNHCGEIAGTIFLALPFSTPLRGGLTWRFGPRSGARHPPRARVAEGTLSARKNLISLSEIT